MPAVAQADLQGISTSVEKVLNEVQQFLSFPKSSTNPTFSYQFFGELSVDVEASWEIIPGFVLDTVSIVIALNTASDGKFSIYLS